MEYTTTLILNSQQIDQKIRRMAYQVYEQNSGENEIIIAGIKSSGYKLAEQLVAILAKISDLQIKLCQLEINKKNPLAKIHNSIDESAYENKVVVIVDDVLNSGSTLIYAAKFFLDVPLKKLQTLVLVDRSHKKFPVKADFKGISLSTSLNEMVKVTFGEKSAVELY